MALRTTLTRGREGIEMSGLILPGRNGRVYVTPDEYDTADEAQRRLALHRRPTGYFEVPRARLSGLSEPEEVHPHNGQPGGGREQYVDHAVDASRLPWHEVEP